MKFNKSWIALIAVSQILAACTDGMQKTMSTVRIAPTGAPGDSTSGSGGASMNEQMGTGDGGGGNAINFKMLESYMFDPNELAIVRTRIAPLFKRVFSSPKEEPVVSDEGTSDGERQPVKTFDVFAYKNWYLAPMNLKVIPKDVLGIEFTEGGHQQVAIQTREAIWIDSNIFSKMSDEEKVRLIIHEVMMMAYLMRFENMIDICKMTERGGGENCSELAGEEDIARYYVAEERRPLNSKDYEIIRSMTAWMLKNEVTATEEQYMQHANRIGFTDARFKYGTQESETVTVGANEISQALRLAYHSGVLSNICVTEKLGLEVPCELRFESREDSKLEVFLVNPETEKILHRAVFYLNTATELIFDSDKLATINSTFTSSPKDGERLSALQIVFRKGRYVGDEIRFEQISATPMVAAVSAVVNEQSCYSFKADKVFAQDLASDRMILKRKDVPKIVRTYDMTYGGCVHSEAK